MGLHPVSALDGAEPAKQARTLFPLDLPTRYTFFNSYVTSVVIARNVCHTEGPRMPRTHYESLEPIKQCQPPSNSCPLSHNAQMLDSRRVVAPESRESELPNTSIAALPRENVSLGTIPGGGIRVPETLDFEEKYPSDKSGPAFSTRVSEATLCLLGNRIKPEATILQ